MFLKEGEMLAYEESESSSGEESEGSAQKDNNVDLSDVSDGVADCKSVDVLAKSAKPNKKRKNSNLFNQLSDYSRTTKRKRLMKLSDVDMINKSAVVDSNHDTISQQGMYNEKPLSLYAKYTYMT